MARYVAYYRVSTDRQGRSGLGLEAQRVAVRAFLGDDDKLLDEHAEIESGRRDDRPELRAALHVCRIKNATLLIAKFDRLSRNAAFLLGLRDSGVKFVACDMPEANNLTLGVMALMAQQEREWVSTRTKQALMVAKARGVRLGRPENLRRQEVGRARGNASQAAAATKRARDLRGVVQDIRNQGVTTLRGIAAELNAREIVSPAGGLWSGGQVHRLLTRLVAGGGGDGEYDVADQRGAGPRSHPR